MARPAFKMECLKDYIGLRGCNSLPTPLSGQYLNQLAGINLKSIDSIADSEQVTYLNVWEDVQQNTIHSFRTAVIAAFRKTNKYKLKSISQVIDFGRLIDKINNQTVADENFRGFTVELTFGNLPTNVWLLRSSLQMIYVQSISLFTPTITSGVVVNIIDLDTSEIIYTKTLDTIAGWNQIEIEKYFDANRVFICYDATNVDSAYQDITPYIATFCGACVTPIYGVRYYGKDINCGAYIWGGMSDTLDPATFVLARGQNSFGLTGKVSLRCVFDWLVCGNKEHFTEAWKYALGVNLMQERIHSDRINRYTTIDAKAAEELLNFYQAQLDEALEIACDGINIQLTDCCIDCQPQVQHVTSMG